LVGASGGDQGKECEERTHCKAKEGKTKRKVKEVDEKGRGIREKNVGSSRDGRLYLNAWLKRTEEQHGSWAEEKKTSGGAINTA
jgi:hypothetical protein